MRIRRKIKIGPHEVKIIYKKKIFNDKIELSGYADAANNKIYLEYNMPKTKKMEVFLHECLHVMDDIYSLALGEKRVNALATILVNFIRTNGIDFNDRKR